MDHLEGRAAVLKKRRDFLTARQEKTRYELERNEAEQEALAAQVAMIAKRRKETAEKAAAAAKARAEDLAAGAKAGAAAEITLTDK